jgi:hypothetical protein
MMPRANSTRQFEFVESQRSNTGDCIVQGDRIDPIIGRRDRAGDRADDRLVEPPHRRRVWGLAEFTILRGGDPRPGSRSKLKARKPLQVKLQVKVSPQHSEAKAELHREAHFAERRREAHLAELRKTSEPATLAPGRWDPVGA